MNEEEMSQEKSHLNILYVEDDENVQKLFLNLLQRKFEKIWVANNGLEGLAIFEKQPIDLVITDIHMPQMDGLSMAKKMKEKKPNLPIIITSAYSDKDYKQQAKAIGIDHYMVKPIILADFLKVLELFITKT